MDGFLPCGFTAFNVYAVRETARLAALRHGYHFLLCSWGIATLTALAKSFSLGWCSWRAAPAFCCPRPASFPRLLIACLGLKMASVSYCLRSAVCSRGLVLDG